MFDIALMNPPYDNGLHEKFLLKCLDISNKNVTIQPTSWILSKRKNSNIINKLKNCYTNIDILNGNVDFDAAFAGDVSINYISSNHKFDIILNGKHYNDFDDIKPWSTNETLSEFVKFILPIKDSLWEHIKGTTSNYHGYEENPDDDWYCIKIPQIRGNVASNSGTKQSKDFYTLISNDEDFINKTQLGQYHIIKNIPNIRGKYDFAYFAFDTKNELDNFINYIKTDFVRACLALTKTHNNQLRGEFKNIPWFDFTDSHFSKSPKEIDNWLFKKYNISDEIRKHIEETLPDYYNIR